MGSRVARGHAVALAEAWVGPPRKGGDHTASCPQFLLACTSGLRHQPALPPRDSSGAGAAPCPGHPGPGRLLGADGAGGFGSSAPGQGSQGHADPNWSARGQPWASGGFRSPCSPTSEEAPEAGKPAPGRRESGPSVRGSDPEVSDKAGFQPSDHPQLQVGTGRVGEGARYAPNGNDRDRGWGALQAGLAKGQAGPVPVPSCCHGLLSARPAWPC